MSGSLHAPVYQKGKLTMMKGNNDEMNNNIKQNTDIEFENYAPLDREYSKKELAEIYKRIIKDITNS